MGDIVNETSRRDDAVEARDVSAGSDLPNSGEREVERLSSRARRGRGLASLFVLAAIFAGSAWGSDDHFPFGPFKMYTTARKLSGTVNVPKLEIVTADGEETYMPFDRFGLRRAEVEGQIPRIVEDPSLLAYLVEAHEHYYPDAPRLVEVRLVNFYYQLEDGRPVGEYEETLASWRRS